MASLLVVVFVISLFDFVISLNVKDTSLINNPKAYADSSGFVYVQNGKLMLDGQPYRFTGVNAYSLATYWGSDSGCGGELSDAQLNSFFGELAPYSMVRFWAFQGSMADDVNNPSQRNWTQIDRVINAAAAHNIKLDVGLSDQAGTCDDGYWHDIAWYEGGYKNLYHNPNNYDINTESYYNYVQDIVKRYANNPTIAFWEPVNEPEGSECSNPTLGGQCWGNEPCNEVAGSQALIDFFNNIGSTIRSFDSNHLIAAGLLGGGQCGMQGGDYQRVISSSGIDVATYHDYGADDQAIPADVQSDILAAKAVNKPVFLEESGISATNTNPTQNGCITLNQRETLFYNKMTAQFAAGAQGFVPWDWAGPDYTSTCSLNIDDGDPTLTLLHDNAFIFNPLISGSSGNSKNSSSSANSNNTNNSKSNSTKAGFAAGSSSGNSSGSGTGSTTGSGPTGTDNFSVPSSKVPSINPLKAATVNSSLSNSIIKVGLIITGLIMTASIITIIIIYKVKPELRYAVNRLSRHSILTLRRTVHL